MMKLWSGRGKRIEKNAPSGTRRKEKAAKKRVEAAEAEWTVQSHVSQAKVIDFETLQSWYNQQNNADSTQEAVAAGNEYYVACSSTKKQRELRFLSL